jgi:acyl-CoA dehydrogenase family member 9
LCARAILSFGTEAQRATHLPALARGETLGAFCLSETAAGSDAGGIKTRAERSGDAWKINGTKNYVVNGAHAGTFVVFARTSSSEDGAKPRLGAFIVDATNAADVKRGTAVKTHGMPGLEVTDVTFDDVEIPATNLLDEPGRGFRIATDVLNHGRLGLAASCLGAMKRLVRLSTERVQERKAFFRPIAEFALIKDKIALMAAQTFAVESALYLTTGLVDKGTTADASVECAMVKVIASESYFQIAHEAMQIMAGAGYVQPNFADAAVRDARFFLVYQGTNETLRCFIALSGMQAPGEKITEVSRALREPIKGFGLLGDFALRKAKSAFGRERIASAHPLLSREANVLEEYAQLLSRNVDMVLRRHEKNIVEMQYTQRRVADIATDLYALAACIARTTRAIERRGEDGSRREMDLLSIFASACERRLEANAAAFDKNDDELRKSVADRAYADRGYPLDVV